VRRSGQVAVQRAADTDLLVVQWFSSAPFDGALPGRISQLARAGGNSDTMAYEGISSPADSPCKAQVERMVRRPASVSAFARAGSDEGVVSQELRFTFCSWQADL